MPEATEREKRIDFINDMVHLGREVEVVVESGRRFRGKVVWVVADAGTMALVYAIDVEIPGADHAITGVTETRKVRITWSSVESMEVLDGG